MITARYSADDLSGKRRCKAALQRRVGLPQRARVPLVAITARLVPQKGLDLILHDPRLPAAPSSSWCWETESDDTATPCWRCAKPVPIAWRLTLTSPTAWNTGCSRGLMC
jgi:hypothetical protein